jgi:hypothetical protein
MSRTTSKPLKGNKKYHDAPRYPVIYQYEDDFKDNWKRMLKVAIAEFTIKLTKELS